MCISTGAQLGFSPVQLSHLAGAAVMHDNALTEYIALRQKSPDPLRVTALDLTPHCRMGEENMKRLPFYADVQNVVLYHHENADGSGPFGLTARETPVFAQLIHLCDQVDNAFHLDEADEDKYAQLLQWLRQNRGSLFDGALADAFKEAVSYGTLLRMRGDGVLPLLSASLPEVTHACSEEDICSFSDVFAHITDFKSHFTSAHSQGIAQKARTMGRYLHAGSEECTKLYLAGALHDVGKLAIPNAILEKPDRLTPAEFAVMKTHAQYSWDILKELTDVPDVVSWACMHHEKLDGSGYPFGRTAAGLGRNERLLACLDIYQALTEPRPYKSGMDHDAAMRILCEMAGAGKLDAALVDDIGSCFGAAVRAAS